MDHMPQLENVACAGQKKDALAEFCLIAHCADRPLEVPVASATEAGYGAQFATERERMPAYARHAQRTRDVQRNHVA